ncbi:bicaudal D-related protein [Apis mellifera caucasica]|uniref:Bicaudal D-related protein homolog n=1 Tax=Apis mellifera TaxID=7460 RepID=A0A7M7IT70_APIME|nr:bicaudal D-related protein homolog [Apis mellifera]KAG6803303.1 bicaudal D-related protein [Apis mellifera caucasica]KAG9435267.1 bicaudal D-related protein [Apis mellifera carnica]|eukprot:XP_016773624.1 bicaudal D-related protein homolog [Apis mellifera]
MLPKKDGHPESYALEDMISDLQARRNSLDQEDLEDPAELLKKRDRDLVLAAELGKALLERNQELTRQSEILAEEYSTKLESLEQERHLLRRRLEEVISENEARNLELQADVETLRSQLEEQNERARRAERDQASLVAELTAQNTRLADQLREAAKQEEQLLIEVKVLREKCALRSTTLQDHVSSLEVLRDEVQLVSAQRAELERRSLELREERARAMAALEEAEDRATALERLGHEAEHRAKLAERERDELAATLAVIEAERRGRSGSIQKPPRSLQAEMECEESGSSLGEQEDLRAEVARAVKRLKELCVHLRRGEDDSGLQSDCDESMLVIVNNNTAEAEQANTNGQETLPSSTNCPGALLDLVEEVYNLSLSGRGAPGELGLAVELHRVREELENAKDQQKQTQEELKRRGEALLDVTSKLSVSEAELRGVKEERDRARDDMEHSQLTKDEILTQAYKVRDQAVARKNRAEVELAKTRIDVLQANSQLMEAIQQKIELSQQLEQWQMDMQSLLDEHVRSKLMPVTSSIAATNSENSEIVAPARKKRSTGSSKKMFGLF